MFVFFIHLWNFGKISIFLASAGTFNVKNDNFHTFFFCCLGCKCWICRLCSKTKIHGLDRFHGNVLQNPDRERTNQGTGICLGLGLPYNKTAFWIGMSSLTTSEGIKTDQCIKGRWFSWQHEAYFKLVCRQQLPWKRLNRWSLHALLLLPWQPFQYQDQR